MKLNTSGKFLTTFVIIIAILLLGLTAVSIFYGKKAMEEKELTDLMLSRANEKLVKLDKELLDIRKQSFLLEEKNKEADERINSLMDELELEQGIREEVKIENTSMKEKLGEAKKEKEKLEEKLARLNNAEQKIVELETKLKAEIDLKEKLQAKLESLENSFEEQTSYVTELEKDAGATEKTRMDVKQAHKEIERQVELEKIVVVPRDVPEGRILSVDKETEFVIVNLGSKDGLDMGRILSVYRGKEYLGDVKVTRIQSEMSAADLIPPFSSQIVRKNDQVIVKE